MINNEIEELAKDLFQFMKKKLKIDRQPQIIFKENITNAENILGRTGYYDPESNEICIYITKRHPKDILRSLAHEIIHHAQVCEGSMDGERAVPAADENYILHDDHLREMERDAFERGNIIFREWEAYKKMNKKQTLEENKKKRKLSIKKYNKAKKMAASMEKKQGYSAEKAHKIAFAQVQKESTVTCMKESKEPDKKTSDEVEVNEILKNSPYYRPEDRACNEIYKERDELIYQEMLKKFGIKK